MALLIIVLMDMNINMSVSSVVGTGKDRKIYILFSDPIRSCEAIYPDCKVMKNDGFTREEVEQLEVFMTKNADTIKSMAKTVSIWKAFGGPSSK